MIVSPFCSLFGVDNEQGYHTAHKSNPHRPPASPPQKNEGGGQSIPKSVPVVVPGAADLEHCGERPNGGPRRTSGGHLKDGSSQGPHVRLNPPVSQIVNLKNNTKVHTHIYINVYINA